MTNPREKVIAGLTLLAIVAAGVFLFNRPSREPAPATDPAVKPQAAASFDVGRPGPAAPAVGAASRPGPVTVRPAVPLDAEGISPTLRTLIGLTPDAADYEKRQVALRSLTRRLTPGEIAILLTFLETHFGDYQGLRAILLNAIKNDILDVLIRQDQPVTNLGSRLVAMFRDPAQDDTWHDYCIQYLIPYYSATWVPPAPGVLPAPVIDQQRQEIATACWDAAAQSNKGIAGTALIGLETLSRQYPEFDRERVGRLATVLADDEQTCEATRISALRLCGMLKRAEALVPARIVAQTGRSIPLRMAAIATLGDLGEQQDLEYLQAVAAVESPRLKPIIEAAVRLIRARQGTGKS
jgi:hypothetical protein